jgi:hypothetical protein
MTVYAAVHANIYFSAELIPFCNWAVTSLARCAAIQVYFVAEVHESRKFVNANPRNGPVRFCMRSQGSDRGAVSLYCSMTSHTRLGLRYGFYVTGTNQFMAVIALQACVRRMLFVTKRNWLYGGARLILCVDCGSRKQDKRPGSQITPVRICSAR